MFDNRAKLEIFGILVPGSLNFDPSKKNAKNSLSSVFDELSIAFLPVSIALLVFELDGGGVFRILDFFSV